MKGVCYKFCILIMEYLYFSFIFFEENKWVSFLDDFLLYIDVKYSFEGFKDLVVFVVRDIVCGFVYFYGNGVGYRDLKAVKISVIFYMSL